MATAGDFAGSVGIEHNDEHKADRRLLNEVTLMSRRVVFGLPEPNKLARQHEPGRQKNGLS